MTINIHERFITNKRTGDLPKNLPDVLRFDRRLQALARGRRQRRQEPSAGCRCVLDDWYGTQDWDDWLAQI